MLPRHTISTLRLVCRAARDDFVDGRCTKLRPLRHDPDPALPLAAAPRLRRLECMYVPAVDQQTKCADVAAFLGRLPGAGAALKELRFRHIRGDSADPAPLSAAVGALPGLRLLHAAVVTGFNARAAAAVLGALGAGLRAAPPAARLSLRLHGSDWDAGAADLAALLPLGKLEALEVGAEMLQRLTPQLLAPEAAAALTALRSLDVRMFGVPARAPLADYWAVWRAPWLAQLATLSILGTAGPLAGLAGALAPRALASLRGLHISHFGAEEPLPPAVLGALLEACDPATLEELSTSGVGYADAARAAERLPALASLGLWMGRRCPQEKCEALASARLAPLTSLSLDVGGWLPGAPGSLAALASAPWAASLRKVALYGALPGLCTLQPLGALRALTGLHLSFPRLSVAELRAAGAAGSSDDAGWARRLEEFTVGELELVAHAAATSGAGAAMVRAWLSALSRARARRLRLLTVMAAVGADEKDALLAECARALPAAVLYVL